MTVPSIHYANEPALELAEFRRVLAESGLGTRRPLNDDARLGAMLSAAGLLLTARLEHPTGPLVGIARCLTDSVWSCYIADLAVVASAQGLKVGKGLLAEARRKLGPSVSIVLVSVPDALSFYERTGMERVPDAFWYPREP